MQQSFSSASRVLIICASLVVIIAGLKYAAPLLVPFLLSVFIAVISFPLMCRLQQGGLPLWLSLTVVILLVIIIGTALAVLVGSSITDFSRTLPQYQERIANEWSHVLQWLTDHGFSISDTIRDVINPGAAVSFVSAILKGFGNVLTDSFLILLTVTFILLEAAGLTSKFILLNNSPASENESTGETGVVDFSTVFVEKLRHYMSMKTILSVLTGLIIGFSLWLIGVDYPLLWGVLAFILNFVPNIGSIIAAVPAVLLTIVQLGFTSALMVAGVYVVVNTIVGNFIEPKYMGKGLGLSTLVVFVSLVFWGWVLGPVGMLLSVPLTIAVKLALDSKPETQWLGHLLGPVDA